MKVRWSTEAAEDLAIAAARIARDKPEVARRVAKDIFQRAGAIVTFPMGGRKCRVHGTRELPLPPLPCIVVYRVTAEAIEIANIIHGAQQ